MTDSEAYDRDECPGCGGRVLSLEWDGWCRRCATRTQHDAEKPKNSFDGFLADVVADCVGPGQPIRKVTHPLVDCPDCDGEGWWEIGQPERRREGDGYVIERRRTDCPYCGGKGKR